MVALATLHRRPSDERGFTLIELLVVILIIGILVGVAVPSLLGQRMRAYGASAKQLAGNALTAAETIGTDHDGVFGEGSTSFISPAAIHEYDGAIPTSESQAGGGAWLIAAEATTGVSGPFGSGYYVSAIAPKTQGGETFTIERTATGQLLRKCSPPSVANGCPNGEWG